MRDLHWLVLLLVSGLLACGDDSRPDSRLADASRDARSDSGGADASSTDASAGPHDGGSVDGGSAGADAGSTDAGSVGGDAGGVDAGSGGYGAPCENAGDCTIGPDPVCLRRLGSVDQPGGYCTTSCLTEGCPSETHCGHFGDSGSFCFLRCTTSAECRTAEGYDCVPDGPPPIGELVCIAL